MRARITLCMRDAPRAGHQPSERKLVLNLQLQETWNTTCPKIMRLYVDGNLQRPPASLIWKCDPWIPIYVCVQAAPARWSDQRSCPQHDNQLCWPVPTNVRALSEGKGAGGQIAAQKLCLAPPSQGARRSEVLLTITRGNPKCNRGMMTRVAQAIAKIWRCDN